MFLQGREAGHELRWPMHRRDLTIASMNVETVFQERPDFLSFYLLLGIGCHSPEHPLPLTLS